MRDFLYSPLYLAEIICDMDLSDRVTNELLIKIWESEKNYLYAEHQIDKKKFIKDVMIEINYRMHFTEMVDEMEGVNQDLISIGADEWEEEQEDFNYISRLFIEMRLKMLFIGKQDYIQMKFRTLLDLYGYKRRTAALLSYMHKCLYFYHIETFLRNYTPCSIEDVKLDDYIVFRVLENKRAYLIDEDGIDITQPEVHMRTSSFEIMIGNKKQEFSLYNLKPVNGEVEVEMCNRKFIVSVVSGKIREVELC